MIDWYRFSYIRLEELQTPFSVDNPPLLWRVALLQNTRNTPNSHKNSSTNTIQSRSSRSNSKALDIDIDIERDIDITPTTSTTYYFVFTFHHSIADAISIHMIIDQFIGLLNRDSSRYDNSSSNSSNNESIEDSNNNNNNTSNLFPPSIIPLLPPPSWLDIGKTFLYLASLVKKPKVITTTIPIIISSTIYRISI